MRRMRSTMLPFVTCNQFRAADRVCGYQVFQRGLGGPLQVRQHDIEGEQFVPVAMAACWRTWAMVADLMPVILALQNAVRERASGNAFGQSRHVGRDVVEHPG